MEHYQIADILGNEAENLLGYRSPLPFAQQIQTPSWEAVEQTFKLSNRSPRVLSNLRRLYHTGRLAGSGYLSIFPVDQSIEHTAAYSFYKNPAYFNPETIVAVARDGGCSAIASTVGVLGLVSKKYAEKLPFIVKLNHNELLTFPTKHDQVVFASVKQAAEMGAVGVGATIYFGSEQSTRQLQEVSRLFEAAHDVGLVTILWCYPRNPGFKKDGADYESAVDISSQAIHLGATIGADIVKQKMPTAQHGFSDIGFSKYDEAMYPALLTDHPIDLVRYQVLHAYAGRIPLISSGGESKGLPQDDMREAIKTAVINKRAGGSGLIIGRKVFNHSIEEGVALLNAVQDVYLATEISLA